MKIIDAPFRIRVKSDGSLVYLAIPGTELAGAQFYAMLLASEVRKGWLVGMYDALRYYRQTIIDLNGKASREHIACLESAKAYIANLIWLAEMEQMEVELNA